MYDNAIREAKSKGESSKVRRYTRAMETIKTLQKKVLRKFFLIFAPHCPLLPPLLPGPLRLKVERQ